MTVRTVEQARPSLVPPDPLPLVAPYPDALPARAPVGVLSAHGPFTGEEPPPDPVYDPLAPFRLRSPEHLRVLCLLDVPNWAFDQNVRDMAEALRGRIACDYWYAGQPSASPPEFDRYDVVFRLFWGNCGLPDDALPWECTVGALRACWFRHLDGDAIDEIRDADRALVGRYRAFHVNTQAAYDALSLVCSNVVYLTNPVAMKRFPRPTAPRQRVVASWTGNASHANGTHKGFKQIVIPACAAAGVRLTFAEYGMRRIPPAGMPVFYQEGNVTLCASRSEGASNSVMEAMAAGHALVSTPVGNVPEMRASQVREFGESGILLVDRTPEAFTRALRFLATDPGRVHAMGAINRAEIEARWSWDVWADRYLAFLRRGAT